MVCTANFGLGETASSRISLFEAFGRVGERERRDTCTQRRLDLQVRYGVVLKHTVHTPRIG